MTMQTKQLAGAGSVDIRFNILRRQIVPPVNQLTNQNKS